jgi:hypothetical protein
MGARGETWAWVCVAVLCAVGVASAADTANEVPFVAGQPLPACKPNEGWTLVQRSATYKTVSE